LGYELFRLGYELAGLGYELFRLGYELAGLGRLIIFYLILIFDNLSRINT